MSSVEYDVLVKLRVDRAAQKGLGDSVKPLAAGLAKAQREQRFQFERHGYFVADRVDSKPGAPVFNRTVTLKDSWAKGGK